MPNKEETPVAKHMTTESVKIGRITEDGTPILEENQGAAMLRGTVPKEEVPLDGTREDPGDQRMEMTVASLTLVPARRLLSRQGTNGRGLVSTEMSHGLGLATQKGRLCTS